jgi:hypothetical protein
MNNDELILTILQIYAILFYQPKEVANLENLNNPKKIGGNL